MRREKGSSLCAANVSERIGGRERSPCGCNVKEAWKEAANVIKEAWRESKTRILRPCLAFSL